MNGDLMCGCSKNLDLMKEDILSEFDRGRVTYLNNKRFKAIILWGKNVKSNIYGKGYAVIGEGVDIFAH
jgi:hypothetical protein